MSVDSHDEKCEEAEKLIKGKRDDATVCDYLDAFY
jgi:hypothetical protein